MTYTSGQEVILHDPVSGKPVNFGVIKEKHTDVGFYQVDIERLNNHFIMNWHEELIKPSSPHLFKQQNQNLDRAEQLSVHLVDARRAKRIPADHTMDIPASFAQHSYILRYKEMNIDGKKEWHLLTFEEYSIENDTGEITNKV